MTNAAITPLFERLVDENPEASFEKKSKRFLTFEELQNSILNDLSYLLNTRVAPLWKSGPLPYSYGVNVTAPTSAENVFEIQELESRIDNVVRRFEPRLVNAKSQVINVGSDPSCIFISIDAAITLENHKTPLSFPVVIDI
ncbi:MAG: type VI secretion system baseplate subunit TssE [Holosporaceae bacterium]|jgi:type VI secretion system lysozyme-like protein|nr:type VI secretion system baseplate subunit TssE [Holosporaceae bacterium]